MGRGQIGFGGTLNFFERSPDVPVDQFTSEMGCGVLALTVPNLATTGFFNYILANMGGTPIDLTIRGLGLGFGTSVPTNLDADLTNPWLVVSVPKRYPVTLFSPAPATGAATFSFFSPSSDNPLQTITEAGLFCGNASGTIGFMATHALFNYVKGPQTDLRIDYTLQRI